MFCQANRDQLLNTMETPAVESKLLNFLKRAGFQESSLPRLREEIQNNPYLQAVFAKDLKKQNFYELSQREYLEKAFRIGNTHSLYCVNNVFEKRKTSKVKSIDFSLEYEGVNFYCFAKHIDGSGGSQTNQYNDLLLCVEQTERLQNFLVVVSGTFFTIKQVSLLKKYSAPYHIKILDLNRQALSEIKDILMDKREKGQFYTTQATKILEGMAIPEGVPIIEPFAGQGDLVRWAGQPQSIELYDLEPKLENCIQRDTLTDPPMYTDKFVLSNPPYLGRNKCSDERTKTIFERHKGVSDLFRIHIQQIVQGACWGGILIIPLNFICGTNKNSSDRDIRQEFFTRYTLERINIFEEPVFEDTNYSIVALQFRRAPEPETSQEVDIHLYPSGVETTITLKSPWMIGSEIYSLPTKQGVKVSRLTTKGVSDEWYVSHIFLHAIDSQQPIRLEWREEPFYGIVSDRAFATLVFKGVILTATQEHELIDSFNGLLEHYRTQYHSLFLTQYRERGRKRITFDLAYHLVGHLLETI